MSDQEDQPRNRRERRAAAKKTGNPIAPPSSAPKIKLAQPDRSKPKTKTLLDLYDEKKDLLEKGQPFHEKYDDGKVRDESGNILDAGLDSDPLNPAEQAIFWSAVLSMLHFTLDVLVFNQYRQDIEWWDVFTRSFTVLPILFFLIYLLRTKTAKKFPNVRQAFFLLSAAVGGCYMIHIANTYDYYAVMKQAPPVGTLWVWSVIEMDIVFAVSSVLLNVAFAVWKGYSVY